MRCETLDVWKISARLSADVFKTISPGKDFGFRDQICRSGLSIPGNIAEGMEKESIRERIKFLDIAKGSAAEFITQVYIGKDIDYITSETSRDCGFKLLNMFSPCSINSSKPLSLSYH